MQGNEITREEVLKAANEAATRDLARLEASGLAPSETLVRALAERAAHEFLDQLERERQASREVKTPGKRPWWKRWTFFRR